MKNDPGATRLVAILLALLGGASGLRAQQPPPPPPGAPDPAAVYKSGVEAFDSGRYEEAIGQLNDVIKVAGPANLAALEPAYFDVAAAYYNLKRFDEALNAFKTYRVKFPKGARLADAAFSIANCLLGKKDYIAALTELKPLEEIPQRREQVLFLEASILSEQKKTAEAIKPLELLTAGGLHTSLSVRGALLLASLYVQKSEFTKATAMMNNIQGNLGLVDNILQFNGLIIELGDKLLTTGLPRQALALYRFARSRKECIAYEAEHLASLERQVATNVEKFRATKDRSFLEANQSLQEAVTDGRKDLEDVRKAPDFEPGLLFRMSRAYQDTGKQWEAILVNRRLIDKYPEAQEREPASFSLIACLADTGQSKKALEACESYLKAYPTGTNAPAVAYLRGAMALDSGDYSQAVTYFGTALRERPEGQLNDRMTYLIANARLMQGDPNAALTSYEDYLKKFPTGEYAVECRYRVGLCLMFTDKYEEAMNHFQAFVKENPNSEFTPDALYRLLVVKYAAQLYNEVIADADAWTKAYPGHLITGEVLALKGDALAAADKRDEAAQTYIASYKAATTDEVLNYSLFEAGKTLGKLGRWDQAAAMFEEFVKNHPEHSAAPAAISSLIQARVKLGQVDQAKVFAAQTIARFIADPSKEAVEKLLTQLAAICARKRQQGVDPKDELTRLLTFTPEQNVPDSPTVKARQLYAQAELASMLRKRKDHDELITRVANDNKPSDLSPLLLGQCGEALLAQHKDTPAKAMFEALLNLYPKCEVLDFAYVGLGELAYRAKDYQKALSLNSKALDETGGAYRIKEATIGKAKALAALGKSDEAVKLFEQVISTKEWRGESTAEAICALGDIEMSRADYAKAIAYYQRVYLAYQKFPHWMAKAYLESARAFEKLGKTQEAMNTYREMVRNEKIADSSEVDEAKKRLIESGQS